MQVEVCIQECYTAVDRSVGPVPVAGSGLISPETWEIWFQKWLEVMQPDLSPIQAYELSLRLTGDHEIHQLNQQYRQQDKPTDVLAFAALETDNPSLAEMVDALPVYLGDIVISIDTAQRQADQQGHSLEIELGWLAAHGFLHLLGWDHPDEDSLRQMLNQQQALLHTVGLAIETS